MSMSMSWLVLVLIFVAVFATGTSASTFVDEKSIGNKVHVSLCTSCSYRGGLNQLQNALKETYPDIAVVASAYPMSVQKQIMCKAVTAVQMSFIALCLAGRSLLQAFNLNVYPFVDDLERNKFQNIMMAWFVGNLVSSNLQSTGAFEIHYNGELIYSKLESKRLPNINEVLDLIATLREKYGYNLG